MLLQEQVNYRRSIVAGVVVVGAVVVGLGIASGQNQLVQQGRHPQGKIWTLLGKL